MLTPKTLYCPLRLGNSLSLANGLTILLLFPPVFTFQPDTVGDMHEKVEFSVGNGVVN